MRLSLPGLGVAPALGSLAAVCCPSGVCGSAGSFSKELNSDKSDVELDIFRAVSSSVHSSHTRHCIMHEANVCVCVTKYNI